jgi:hypothetical protein
LSESIRWNKPFLDKIFIKKTSIQDALNPNDWIIVGRKAPIEAKAQFVPKKIAPPVYTLYNEKTTV